MPIPDSLTGRPASRPATRKNPIRDYEDKWIIRLRKHGHESEGDEAKSNLRANERASRPYDLIDH